MSLYRITKLEQEARQTRNLVNVAVQTATQAQTAVLNSGGYVPVATYSDIAAYPAAQRIEGMQFYVIDTGITYRLGADLATVTPSALKMWCADDSSVRELKVVKVGSQYTIEIL